MRLSGNDGKEISIILICSERRTFGSNILNKLFSIGVYNALIGNDRSINNLCKLINRPRTKKEAKLYYRIDQATYESAIDNGEVSENEIQNILNHFKKLGKSTDRYTDSFNNIAAQYTDDQLKLIINVLPIKVKAVLEAESEKYQSLMGTSPDERRNVAPVEQGISVNTIGNGRDTSMNGPIVIPSGVKRFTGGSRPVVPNNVAARPNPKPANSVGEQVQPVQRQAQVGQTRPQVAQTQQQQVRPQTNQIQQQARPQANQIQQQARPQANQVGQQVRPQPAQVAQQSAQQVRRESPAQTQGGPVIPKNMAQRVNPVVQDPIVNNTTSPAVEESKPSEGHRYTGTIAQVKRTLIARRKVAPVTAQPEVKVAPAAPIIPEIEEESIQEEHRRGRGRPKKIVSEEELNKPKGKRGRPRKNLPEEESNLDELLGGLGTASNDEIMMPGLEEDENAGVLPGLEDGDDEGVLPGLEVEEDDGFLPGLEEDDNNGTLPGLEEDDDNGTLPGLEEDDDDGFLPGLEVEDDNGTLPGLEVEEEDEATEEGEEVDVNSLLAGLDDDTESSLPGLDSTGEEDETLPGLDDIDEDDGLLPGMEDESGESDEVMIPGLDDTDEDDGVLPGMEDKSGESDEVMIPGLDDTDEDDGVLPGIEDEPEEETILPGMGFEDDSENEFGEDNNNYAPETNAIESIKPQIDYSMSNLNSLLSKDKKIVTFVGATKNGTSFLINNLALMFSMMGIDVAILDMTKNKNSYYLFTDSREELRKIAYTSLSKLENGYADGIKFNKNLTVYTGLPSDGTVYENAEPILSTLVQNHSLVLIDSDFTTPPAYFASSQEIYLVQSMDILTIQPLTEFLRELKFKGAWEPEKARVVINKEVPIRILSAKTIIGGMSRYNGADMSVMTDLFNKDMVKACSIPFDEKVYAKYLETLATCKLSISSLPKQFRTKLQILGEMVYPRLNSKTSYSPSPEMGGATYNPNGNAFSNDTNNILNKMKKKF